jgi:hypothetical protein
MSMGAPRGGRGGGALYLVFIVGIIAATLLVREGRDLPADEARSSFVRGDRRPGGRLGFDLAFPEIELERARTYGAFQVDPAGCVTDSEGRARFHEAAFRYVRRSDLELAQLIPSSESPVVQPCLLDRYRRQ